MSRAPVVTRTATRDDVPALVELWGELRDVGGRAVRAVDPTADASVVQRLNRMLGEPGHRVVVASLDGEVAGMAVLSLTGLSPLSDAAVVKMTSVVVRGLHRRRGVGHALVGAAVSYAEEIGVDHVVVSVFPGLRDANRFYARLGFAPLATRRIAPVAALRRRLALTDIRTGVAEDVVRRRTRLLRPRVPPRMRSIVSDLDGPVP